MSRMVTKSEFAKASKKRLSIEPMRKRMSFVKNLLSPNVRMQKDCNKQRAKADRRRPKRESRHLVKIGEAKKPAP